MKENNLFNDFNLIKEEKESVNPDINNLIINLEIKTIIDLKNVSEVIPDNFEGKINQLLDIARHKGELDAFNKIKIEINESENND